MSVDRACRLLIDAPRPGAWNMAIDEMLLARAGRTQQCCWRFYQWSEPTLSLGYFQRYADRQMHAASRDCAVVRRSTGGGAILHDHELTYSLTVGAGHSLCNSAAELYRRIHGTLIDVLGRLDTSARLHEGSAATSANEPFLCFARRSTGDLVLNEHKICGSAQRRHKGAILQHGSVLLARTDAAPELSGLRESARVELSAEQLIDLWLPALSQSLGVTFERDELTAEELHEAEHIVADKHGALAWIERR